MSLLTPVIFTVCSIYQSELVNVSEDEETVATAILVLIILIVTSAVGSVSSTIEKLQSSPSLIEVLVRSLTDTPAFGFIVKDAVKLLSVKM